MADDDEPKKWDGDGVPLKDSNCAGIGTEEDKALRKQAASTEPAWQTAGQENGIEVWRIEQFKVVPWPKEKYGQFHKGDSYIVLKTTKDEESGMLFHKIHFWLGKETSIDEMGTAAYKTVELDDFFDGEPIQAREVQEHESQAFHEMFPKLTYLEGGCETGFRHAASNVNLHESKLFCVRRYKKEGVRIDEVPCKRESLNEGDVFILDAGANIYLWEGMKSSPFEKNAANIHAEHLENERDGRSEVTHDVDDQFWELLGGEGPIKTAEEVDDAKTRVLSRAQSVAFNENTLYKVSDESGELTVTKEAQGKLDISMLASEDVWMVDFHSEIALWVGSGASTGEGRSCMRIAMDFLKDNNRNKHTPITVYKEGQAIKCTKWVQAFEEGMTGNEDAKAIAQTEEAEDEARIQEEEAEAAEAARKKEAADLQAAQQKEEDERRRREEEEAEAQRRKEAAEEAERRQAEAAEEARKKKEAQEAEAAEQAKARPSLNKSSTAEYDLPVDTMPGQPPGLASVATPAPSTAQPASAPAPAGTYTLAQLTDANEWRQLGVPAAEREIYLPDDVFQELFGMNKEAFAALPAWKRSSSKKKHGLF